MSTVNEMLTDICELWGISIPEIQAKLDELRSITSALSDNKLLEYLRNNDLDINKCADAYFKGSTPKKNNNNNRSKNKNNRKRCLSMILSDQETDMNENNNTNKKRKLNGNNNNNKNEQLALRFMKMKSKFKWNKDNLATNNDKKSEINTDKFLSELNRLSTSSNIMFRSTEMNDYLNPIILYNDNEIIYSQSKIISAIKQSKCVISAIPFLCDIIAGFIVENDNHFTTKQFLQLLVIERNLKQKGLKKLKNSFDTLTNNVCNKSINDLLLNETMIKHIDTKRVKLTVQNVQKMSGIYMDDKQSNNFSFEWVHYLNKTLNDTSIIVVPCSVTMDEDNDYFIGYGELFNSIHQNFVIGRTTNGDIIGFAAFIVRIYSWFPQK